VDEGLLPVEVLSPLPPLPPVVADEVMRVEAVGELPPEDEDEAVVGAAEPSVLLAAVEETSPEDPLLEGEGEPELEGPDEADVGAASLEEADVGAEPPVVEGAGAED
jgi:hypothetical protein